MNEVLLPVFKCDLPPEGWICTRELGHDGPCAATEVGKFHKPFENVVFDNNRVVLTEEQTAIQLKSVREVELHLMNRLELQIQQDLLELKSPQFKFGEFTEFDMRKIYKYFQKLHEDFKKAHRNEKEV